MDLQFFIRWFTDLKNAGVTKDEIFDVLEFDSDVYPEMDIMKQAKEIVYKNDPHCFQCGATENLKHSQLVGHVCPTCENKIAPSISRD